MRRECGLAALLVCVAAQLGVAAPAGAQSGIEVHADGGLGLSVVRPLVSEGALSATASAGMSTLVSRRLRVGAEVTATVGSQYHGVSIPEAPQPGDRSLTTFLLGVESARRGPRNVFAFVGIGVGHMTLSSALGIFEPPYGEGWRIPSRSLTAFATGAAVGYRSGVPGSLGVQFGFRTHALMDAGQIPAFAYALTLGVAY